MNTKDRMPDRGLTAPIQGFDHYVALRPWQSTQGRAPRPNANVLTHCGR